VRRVDALARPHGRPGVAGAVLDADREPHLGGRPREVAADVGGQRPKRRDVERVQAGRRRGPERHEAGQEARQRLAAAGGGDEQGGGFVRAVQHGLLMRVQRPALGGEPVGEGGGERAVHGGKIGVFAGAGRACI